MRNIVMTYPLGDESVQDDPLANSPFQDSTPGISRQSSSREKMADARRRTEHFVRENPFPVIIGALVFGVAVGWALRHATAEDEEPEVETPFGRLNWSYLSLPFLWPFLKSVKEKAGDSAESIKDAARDGMDRVRKIDVDRYAKPLRKRWKAWRN